MRIAQCFTCRIFCSVKAMWLKDEHLYCPDHKPENSESMNDAMVYEDGEAFHEMEGDEE